MAWPEMVSRLAWLGTHPGPAWLPKYSRMTYHGCPMASLEKQFLSNYEFRCSLLRFCRPEDVVMLMKAFEPRICLTKRETKEHPGLYILLFKDHNLIDALCESHIKITVICKSLDELLDIYHDSDKGSSERNFDVIVILSKEYKIVPLYPDMIGKAFGKRTLCSVTVASEWYECSAKVDNAQIKICFTTSMRETVTPFRLPFGVASRFMDVDLIPDQIVSNNIKATTKYLHLHDAARICKTATSLPSGNLYLWTPGVMFDFRVTAEHRGDANIPIWI